MRRIISLLIAAVMLLTLAACGGDVNLGVSSTPTPMQEDVSPTAAPVSNWASQGRAYKQKSLTSYADSFVCAFSHGDDYYEAIMYWNEIGKTMYAIMKNEEIGLYSTENATIYSAGASDAGVWIVETEKIDASTTNTCGSSRTQARYCSPSPWASLVWMGTIFSSFSARVETCISEVRTS